MSKPPRKDNPSSTFYWKDYENDEGLRISSLAAQGLWMRLLCIAAKADPYGYILVNGCDPGVTGTARLGSVTEAEAATLLDELERNGVFSRDRKGRPFSRRMVKEAAISAKNRKNGKKGGNPALGLSDGKEKEKEGSVNPPDKPRVKAPYPLPFPTEEEEKEEPIGSSKKSPPRKRPETDLPDGWVPSERNISDAEAKGFTAQEINDEADRFRDHHAAKGTRFRDWDAAWRTWLGNARKFGARGGMAGKAGPSRYGQGSSIASIVLRRQSGGAD